MKKRPIIFLVWFIPLILLGVTLFVSGDPGQIAKASASPSSPQVGIWYSTWYSTAAKYIWTTGHGVGSTSQMLADVNGDGKADAVVFFNGPDGSTPAGRWYVALSNGDGFNGYKLWTAGHGLGSSKQFLADVNGDGKADAVVFFPNGDWYVALSNGNGFDPYKLWKTGFGAGSTSQFLADVTGDGKADTVAFYNDPDGVTPGGRWYVAPSTGSSFGDLKLWIAGHGVGSTSQMLADVNGDGKADAVVFFNEPDGVTPGGRWYVALSNGNGFNGYALWTAGHGFGSSKQMLADVNGDGKADAVVFFPGPDAYKTCGRWYVALSNGSGFNNYQAWKNGFGITSSCQASDWQTVSDVKGDKKASPIAFFNSDGSWKVMPSDLDKTDHSIRSGSNQLGIGDRFRETDAAV
ncbi:MAG: VCBS repeat-containing protein [Actinobacteria bacterium]|nr:VCBS repeat-containing protein [Actinomycetota bacterium]